MEFRNVPPTPHLLQAFISSPLGSSDVVCGWFHMSNRAMSILKCTCFLLILSRWVLGLECPTDWQSLKYSLYAVPCGPLADVSVSTVVAVRSHWGDNSLAIAKYV